jgi:hypothetical protein
VPDFSDDLLERLTKLDLSVDPPPWRARIEGEDHVSGDSFISTGDENDRREDMYVSRDSGPASDSDLKFIAEARNLLPKIIAEIRELRGLNEL